MHKRVCTLTPNPALDIGGIVDNIRPNEKSYVHDETRDPGGNGINVARILTRLNIPVVTTGFLGGSTGEEVRLLLDKENVENRFVEINGHTRISLTVSNRIDHKQTRLSFPGPHVTKEEEAKLLSFIRGQKQMSLLVVGGTLPKGFSTKNLKHCLAVARKNGANCIVDSPAKILREVISSNPIFIKPNLIEFQELTNSGVKSIPSVHKEAKKLLTKIPFVCVSSVEGGALLITRNHSYFGRIAKVKIKSTVGAGDSMVGAIAAQMFKQNFEGSDLLRWGLAASAATLSEFGTALGGANAIRHLYQKTRIECLK